MTTLLQHAATGWAPLLKQWTAAEYSRLIEQGLVTEGAPLELIDGTLISRERSDSGAPTTASSPRHATVVYRLSRLDRHLEPHGCHLRT